NSRAWALSCWSVREGRRAGEIQRLNADAHAGVYTDDALTALGLSLDLTHRHQCLTRAGRTRDPWAKDGETSRRDAARPILTIIFVALVLLMVVGAYVADQRDS